VAPGLIQQGQHIAQTLGRDVAVLNAFWPRAIEP
jgi:hypothetical protein